MLEFDDRIYFNAHDGEHGDELWRTNGTASGTFMVGDFVPGPRGLNPRDLTHLDEHLFIMDTLFFSAETPERGREPWVSDGTPRGTRPLREIAPGVASSTLRDFTRSGWDVFFSAEESTYGRELYALPFRPECECDQAKESH